MEIWGVRYQTFEAKHPKGRHWVEFFETERRARAFYRRLWKNGNVLDQSVQRQDIPFRILSLKNGGTVPAEWTVKIRVSGHRRIVTVLCGTHDLWNLRRFQKILVEQASVELYDVDFKTYEWRALLGFFAGKIR